MSFFVHGPSSLSTKVSRVLILVTIISLFIHTRRLNKTQPNLHGVNFVEPVVAGQLPEEQYLARLSREYGLTNQTAWTAWRLRSSEQQAPEWASVTDLDTDFNSNQAKIIDVQSPDRLKLMAKRQLDVPVPGSPLPEQIDASDFLFGMSSTYQHVSEHDYALVKDWARWLTGGNKYGNGATFVLVLDQTRDEQVNEVEAVLDKFGIDAYVTTSIGFMSTARRYFEMVEVMKEFGTSLAQNGQHKKWFGLLDENVFLPNLAYLQDRLFSYNSDDELYVGLPSERSDFAIGDGVATTYGGGAIFLTRAAVGHIPELTCSDGSDAGGAFRGKRWDSLLQDCLMKHTDLTMHILPSFYSPTDDNEYVEGADSYETGIQPLTLHHSEERHLLKPSIAHLVTDVCGEACFLQRYRFHDNWVLVNGYSISEHPDGLRLDSNAAPSGSSSRVGKRAPETSRLSMMGRVQVDEDAIERKTLTSKGRRNVWRLLDSVTAKNGAVWQAYVKRGCVGDAASLKRAGAEAMDSVIVMIWETAASAMK
ncbi:hypothetical protein G7046_g3541 [Stylonectria norvegica]|nr:hypothetical protein G7046_g3541 [Stylonectria norvegica]